MAGTRRDAEGLVTPAARSAAAQSELDRRNAVFWNERCGAVAAIELGLTAFDQASLAVFDQWFFERYPFLDRFVPYAALEGQQVLEVGLGYGSVSQRLAEHGARLTALDIAASPVSGIRDRLAQCGLTGSAIRGSILDPPFRAGSFDYIVAIGCYHHTGDMARAIAQTSTLLREGGGATIMAHNATAYLRWRREPGRTLRYVVSLAGRTPEPLPLPDNAAYDVDSKGNIAPETVLVSKTHFSRLLHRHFRHVRVARVNADAPRMLNAIPRSVWLATLGRAAGLDLYAQVRK